MFAAAESTLTRAVAVKEAVTSADDPEVAVTLRQLAIVHFLGREFDRAAPLFMRCADIMARVDPTHHLLEGNYKFLAFCAEKTGDFHSWYDFVAMIQ